MARVQTFLLARIQTMNARSIAMVRGCVRRDGHWGFHDPAHDARRWVPPTTSNRGVSHSSLALYSRFRGRWSRHDGVILSSASKDYFINQRFDATRIERSALFVARTDQNARGTSAIFMRPDTRVRVLL